MPLPATDGFTGTDNTTLPTYSSNWSNGLQTCKIKSNGATGDGAGFCIVYWNADAFNNDQYAQVVIKAGNNAEYNGGAVRCSAGGGNGYAYITDVNINSGLWKVVNGSGTQLGSSSSGGGVNDVYRTEAEGTTIRPIRNGALDTGIGAQTDSSLASGSGGLMSYNDAATAYCDDWEAGNLGGAPASLVVRRHVQRLQSIYVR